MLLAIGQMIASIETLYFIKKYGWHWTAMNGWELMWDVISIILAAKGIYNLIISFICDYANKQDN